MTPNPSSPLRHAVIGVGAGIFSLHRAGLTLEGVQVVGVSDVVPTPGQERADELDCPFYTDHRKMLAETKPDVTVIITPHPFHAALAIDALNAGSHVLVEKPMAVQVAEADAMIAAAEANHRLLAVNFQHRFRADAQAVKRLISGGGLGKIQRVTGVQPWLRTAAYFRQADWRGTWKGEGGGVLMNQAPHDLDLLCYLVGLPSRLFALTRTRFHAIETEDTVTALLEWPDGGQGSLYFSTTDYGPRTLEIAGTGGVIKLSEGAPVLERFTPDLLAHIAENPGPFARPQSEVGELPLEDAGDQGHLAVYKDMHRAIRAGGVPLTDGRSSRQSLELANAIIYSGQTGQPVALPLERAAYAGMLAGLIGKAAK
ncbi:MAG: gfo/Idh/MocA family oxidoreductase [Chloroflexi bacterium]|nr:MAG: gfo/Idh/MocA family oxidoreductase [Chloroflexota bacterium]